jgi:glutaconate CoA-transferase subunit A
MAGAQDKVISLDQAGAMIAARKILSLAGSHSVNSPMALIRAAIRAGASALSIIPPVTTSIASDLLIAAGAVDTFYLCYIGFETLGFAPAFRAAAEAGTLNVIEGDEPFVMLGTRAAAGGYPFIPVNKGVYEGTDLPRLNPMLKKVTDPFTGEEVYAIPALPADVCILHAQAADAQGNAQFWGGNNQELDKAMAADCVIVSAERLISVDTTRRDVERVNIPGHMVDAVVHVPYGAHPTASPEFYGTDEAHLKTYFDAVRGGNRDDYLDRFVTGPADHEAYLNAVGLTAMFELQKNA